MKKSIAKHKVSEPTFQELLDEYVPKLWQEKLQEYIRDKTIVMCRNSKCKNMTLKEGTLCKPCRKHKHKNHKIVQKMMKK